MMNKNEGSYVSYLRIPEHWELKVGDKVFISSDVKRLMFQSYKNNDKFDTDKFIDKILSIIGPTGTLIFPTYNWGFCRGETFDYQHTPSRTGYLGQCALKRSDFKRTRHPIYSFAVTGQDKDYLCALDNRSSFGEDSPFGYFRRNNVVNIIINVPFNRCFTFNHHAKEVSGSRDCRYIKNFRADYIDENGTCTPREYNMLVRRLDLNVVTRMEPLEELLEREGVAQIYHFNGITVKKVRLGEAFPYIMKDILENRSRSLCTFIGQDE